MMVALTKKKNLIVSFFLGGFFLILLFSLVGCGGIKPKSSQFITARQAYQAADGKVRKSWGGGVFIRLQSPVYQANKDFSSFLKTPQGDWQFYYEVPQVNKFFQVWAFVDKNGKVRVEKGSEHTFSSSKEGKEYQKIMDKISSERLDWKVDLSQIIEEGLRRKGRDFFQENITQGKLKTKIKCELLNRLATAGLIPFQKDKSLFWVWRVKFFLEEDPSRSLSVYFNPKNGKFISHEGDK